MSEASTPAAASLAEASEDPLRAPSAEDDAPLVMPAFRSLVALYTISFVSQMDGAVMLPTLWPFVEELCGREGCQSHYVYGWAQASFFGTRVVAMFLLGQALDRGASFRGAMQCCLWLATAGGLLYFWAPVLSRARGLGAPTVVAARALLGAGSAASVASFAFIATFVPKPRRTGLFATTIGLQRASTPLAPILVLALSEIPARWGRGAVPVTESDAAGLVVALFNCVAGCVVATYFIEPRRRRRGGAPVKPPSAAAVLRALRRTGAWASFFFSFQNNWNNQAVLWTMPLITSKLYGADPVRDSLLFASGGCVGVLTAVAISSRFFQGRKIRDRTMIVASQCGVGCVLLAMSAFFGCPSLSGRGGAPLWLLWVLFSVYYVPFIGQMPSNNSAFPRPRRPRFRAEIVLPRRRLLEIDQRRRGAPPGRLPVAAGDLEELGARGRGAHDRRRVLDGGTVRLMGRDAGHLGRPVPAAAPRLGKVRRRGRRAAAPRAEPALRLSVEPRGGGAVAPPAHLKARVFCHSALLGRAADTSRRRRDVDIPPAGEPRFAAALPGAR